MINNCPTCTEVQDSLVHSIQASRFGKMTKQCISCGRLWAISRKDRVPFVIEADDRISTPSNRMAFINDPRRRRPR